MIEYTYSGWRISCNNNEAIRQLPPDDEIVKIKLLNTKDKIVHEGWWPTSPTNKRSVMMTGICLWDARWQLEFTQVKKRDPLAMRSFSLYLERKKALESIRKGAYVKKIHYPSTLSIYHQTLINWQFDKILQFQPKRILYHLPIKEYHEYINSLETAIKKSLNFLHKELDLFAKIIFNYIETLLGPNLINKIEFITPYTKGATNPLDAYIFPYKFPEKFDVNPNDVFGVEDLAEIRLAYAAWKQGGAKPIPVLGGIIGSQTNYYSEKNLIDTKFIEI